MRSSENKIAKYNEDVAVFCIFAVSNIKTKKMELIEITEIGSRYALYAFPLSLLTKGLLWAGGLVLAGLAAVLIKKLRPVAKDANIAILGTQGAGKTTLWNAIIKSDKKIKPTIGSETVKETTVTINGIKRRIKQSLDISGSPDNVRREYKKLITEKEHIIFIFDAQKLLNPAKKEWEEVQMRMRTVCTYLTDIKRLHIIASHVDKLEKGDKESKEIFEDILKKLGDDFLQRVNYKENRHIVAMNLTDKKLVSDYINDKLFN